MTWTATRPGGLTGWIASDEGKHARACSSREVAQAYANARNDADEDQAKRTSAAVADVWEHVLGCMDNRSLLDFMKAEQDETGECSEETAAEAEQRGLIVWPEGEDAERGTLTEKGMAAALGAKPDSRILPRMENGLPLCSEACPSFDGKRCEIIGGRPESLCLPAVEAAFK